MNYSENDYICYDGSPSKQVSIFNLYDTTQVSNTVFNPKECFSAKRTIPALYWNISVVRNIRLQDGDIAPARLVQFLGYYQKTPHSHQLSQVVNDCPLCSVLARYRTIADDMHLFCIGDDEIDVVPMPLANPECFRIVSASPCGRSNIVYSIINGSIYYTIKHDNCPDPSKCAEIPREMQYGHKVVTQNSAGGRVLFMREPAECGKHQIHFNLENKPNSENISRIVVVEGSKIVELGNKIVGLGKVVGLVDTDSKVVDTAIAELVAFAEERRIVLFSYTYKTGFAEYTNRIIVDCRGNNVLLLVEFSYDQFRVVHIHFPVEISHQTNPSTPTPLIRLSSRIYSGGDVPVSLSANGRFYRNMNGKNFLIDALDYKYQLHLAKFRPNTPLGEIYRHPLWDWHIVEYSMEYLTTVL